MKTSVPQSLRLFSAGNLTPEEQAEVEAYSRIGSLLGILQSRVRRALKGGRGSTEKARPH